MLILFLLIISSCFGLSVGSNPSTLIRATDSSGLDRPEGMAFTPSGDYIAAVNSLSSTITFYKRLGESGSAYETTPSYSLKGLESKMNYPHDLGFSPDGNHLAVANRVGSSITIYKKNPSHGFYDSAPIAVITGKSSQIISPDTVKYSPIENTIVVANVDNSLTFYRFQGDHYDQEPYQVIRGPELYIPDGLDFSNDGELLAVTSHHAHSVVLFKRLPHSQGYYIETPMQVIKGAETHLCYPHSLSIHPSKNYLAVSCSQGRKNVQIFARKSETFFSNAPELSLEILEMYDASTLVLLEQLQQEGGVKGIAFSPDGKSLAITQNLCQDDLMLPFPVGVLAIYPVDSL